MRPAVSIPQPLPGPGFRSLCCLFCQFISTCPPPGGSQARVGDWHFLSLTRQYEDLGSALSRPS